MSRLYWAPPGILALGAAAVMSSAAPRPLPLRVPLDQSVSTTIGGLVASPTILSDREVEVAGVNEYVLWAYRHTAQPDSTLDEFTLYVGYYRSQTKGKTIHSPKNCLPGAGWEALGSSVHHVQLTDGDSASVNRYLIQNGNQRALVLYWYQGRGRIESNEYIVKWDLLRDAALRHRSDEALVRIVVPLSSDENRALDTADRVARVVIPQVTRSLPL